MIQYGIAQPYEYIYWPLLNLRYIQIISTRLFSLRSLGRPGHHAAAPHQPRRRSLRRLRGLRGSGLPRFAFFTHYPGDVRKMDTEILLWLELYYGTSLVQHGSTWFNLYDGRCPHFGCETAVCTILVFAENAGEWPDLDLQDSHNANLRLLFAEGFRCEVAILRGQQQLVSWLLWCRCRHCCHAGWGARLSSLRQPDLRLGLQEQSLCGRRPGWAPCNACCRRSRLSIDMWGTDFLFMASQVGLKIGCLIITFPIIQFAVNRGMNPPFLGQTHMLYPQICPKISHSSHHNWNRLLLNPSFLRLVALTVTNCQVSMGRSCPCAGWALSSPANAWWRHLRVSGDVRFP